MSVNGQQAILELFGEKRLGDWGSGLESPTLKVICMTSGQPETSPITELLQKKGDEK